MRVKAEAQPELCIEAAIEAELVRISPQLNEDFSQFLSVYTAGTLRHGFVCPIGSDNHPLMHGLYFIDAGISEPAYAVLWSPEHGLALYKAPPTELIISPCGAGGQQIRGFYETDWQPVEEELDKYRVLEIAQALPLLSDLPAEISPEI